MHGDEAVRRDREGGVRFERGGGRRRVDARNRETQREARTREGGGLEEIPAAQLGAHDDTSRAARLIARLMRRCVAPRQMLPVLAATVSSSVGRGFRGRRGDAEMSWP